MAKINKDSDQQNGTQKTKDCATRIPQQSCGVCCMSDKQTALMSKRKDG